MSSALDRIKREYEPNQLQNAIVDGQWSAFQMEGIRRKAAQRKENIRLLMLKKTGYTPEGHALKMRSNEARLRIGGLFLETKKKQD